MTRKEARRIIATWLVSSKGAKGQCGYIEGWFDEEDAEAFRMAIEALSADSDCNNCKEYGSYKCTQCDGEIYFKADGDLISRQAAIRWVKTECNPYGKPTLDFESGKNVIEHLRQMPSAEPVHGEWVTAGHTNGLTGTLWAACSICGSPGDLSDKYCRACGAKMKGGDTE